MNEGPSAEYYTERLPDGRVAMFRGPRPSQPPGKFPRSAQARWDGQNLATVGTRVRVDIARAFLAYCQARDLTPYAVLKEYVERKAAAYLAGGS